MVTSLAAQLAQVAANSKSTLNVKAQKAAHSKSLIWEPKVAATQSLHTLYATCFQGFQDLCQLDARFVPFQATIFSQESQDQDRSQLTASENTELDRQVEAFLRLVGGRLRLLPAIKAIEWLIRRFRIHEENTVALVLAFLPYHSLPAFATLLSILPRTLASDLRFLDPYIRSFTSPPRSVLVYQATNHPEFLTLVSEYTLESCRKQHQHPALVTFWAGLMAESVNGLVDKAKSGRAAIQAENTQALLHRLGPIFAESLTMKSVPSLQIASYMAMALFVSKGGLEDAAVTAFMQQTVHGWSLDTIRPGLVCLAIMAQFRSAKQMGSKITKALIKVPNIGALLVEIGKERRVDKLANGLCLSLIERLIKKGDSHGLLTITEILGGDILKKKQTGVIFKSLLLAALKLNSDNDEDGSLRRELGSVLIALSQISGNVGDIIQTVIEEVEFDIEELEIKLDVSFRSRRITEDAENATNSLIIAAEAETKEDISKAITDINSCTEILSICIVPQPGEIFNEFSHLFFSIVSEYSQDADLLQQFEASPKLRWKTAMKDCGYYSFFVRIWSGPYPALARMAAIDMVKNTVKASQDPKVDLQNLIPYSIIALCDPSKRVRRSAADLIVVLASRYTTQSSFKSVWGAGTLYGKSTNVKPIESNTVMRMLHLQLLPTVEECVMDSSHIAMVIKAAIEQGTYHSKPEPSMDKKDHMSSSGRLALLSFFAAHAVSTPILLVKNRLLTVLNEVKGVGSTSRTQPLLPALQWWASLADEEIERICQAERIDRLETDARFVEVVVPNDATGLEFFMETLTGANIDDKSNLVQAIFTRIRKMWPLMKDKSKYATAVQLLDLSQQSYGDDSSLVAAEASDLLGTIPLTTEILAHFLDSINTDTKIVTEPPPNKRRRTSSSDGGRELIMQVTPELSKALRKATFVLQLVDNSEPISHPELLDGLFTTLSELQHFRSVVGSELGYLQNLVLRSLLAMMPAYKSSKDLAIDSSGGYGDLLVNCIQKSTSPVVQNAALLLIANLATTAPNLVLHSVMPIFTFMSASVLRQNDDYSAHVVLKTIKEVLPPLIASLCKKKSNPIAGASDILLSFATAYEHVQLHRRPSLYLALVETLGPRDFLFALISMLVDRYGASDDLLRFSIELLDNYNIEIQLETLVKLLNLIADVFRAIPEISSILLGVKGDDEAEKSDNVALKQLTAFPNLLSSKKLVSQIAKLGDRDDMEAAEIRSKYATLLENILLLSDTVKGKKKLHNRCGIMLAKLLNLLSIDEFIKAVENLLDRPNLTLRYKVLRALETRIESERRNDADARNALLAFLPQLTAAIRESGDMRYKHTAVTCVDKIAEKYGKKDVEAVVAAAATIAGDDCLGQKERPLQMMALLCLTSLVDVLQDAIVPVLPIAVPQAIIYLEKSLEAEERNEELHSVSYGFLTSLAEHLPYMLSTYMESILHISNKSATAGLDTETNESRVLCLEVLAKKMDGKEMLTSLGGNWKCALSAGHLALSEYIRILGMTIEHHPKSVIAKNSSIISDILLKAFDLRRLALSADDSGEKVLQETCELESAVFETGMKMIYKLNDAAFRPIFQQMVEWPGSNIAKSDRDGRILQQLAVYGFLQTFFDNLKSIVTSYATYVLDDAVKILSQIQPLSNAESRDLWKRVLGTLSSCFEHDQDEFWQSPAHFQAVMPVLLQQFLLAPQMDVETDLIPATVELAAAADSQAHQKELNSALLLHLRSEHAAVRLAAVRCEQALTNKLGEEWLSMLHEMLPRIGELQEDDDESVERETHKWIVKIESVLGENLDAMLQ